jgi:hypothetical protein
VGKSMGFLGENYGNSWGYLDFMGIYGIYIMGFNGIEVST